MVSVADILVEMRNNPRNIRFSDAVKVAKTHFGPPRRSGSHHVFRTPWPGDPRVNLQETSDGKAKAYQVRQILAAIDRLEMTRAQESESDRNRPHPQAASRRGKTRRRD